MATSHLFEELGAPLTNVRWSWGAVTPSGDVILRILEEDLESFWEGQDEVRIRFPQEGHPDAVRLPGYQERLRHIALIQSGANAYGVLIQTKDGRIQSYDDRSLLVGGELYQDEDGTYWLEVEGFKKIK